MYIMKHSWTCIKCAHRYPYLPSPPSLSLSLSLSLSHSLSLSLHPSLAPSLTHSHTHTTALTIGFDPDTYTYAESSGSAELTIRLFGATEVPVTVFFSTQDGSASCEPPPSLRSCACLSPLHVPYWASNTLPMFIPTYVPVWVSLYGNNTASLVI